MWKIMEKYINNKGILDSYYIKKANLFIFKISRIRNKFHLNTEY